MSHSAGTRIESDDIEFVPYACLSQPRARQLEEFCHAFEPDRDGGETPYGWRSTLAWVHVQNFALSRSRACIPFGTLVAFSRRDGALLGMASIVVDDRGVRARHRLEAEGVWGGVVVSHECRGRGVGHALVHQLEARCQAHADLTGKPARFLLFTENPTAERLYSAIGFKFVREISVADVSDDEGSEANKAEVARLLEKVFTPQPAAVRHPPSDPLREPRSPLALCMAALHGDASAAELCMRGGAADRPDPLEGIFFRVTRVPVEELTTPSHAGTGQLSDAGISWLHADGPSVKVRMWNAWGGSDALRFHLLPQHRSCEQPVVFVAGADALRLLAEACIAKPPQHLSFLYELGYEKSWIRSKLSRGQRFRAILWGEGSSPTDIMPATWEGVATFASKHFGPAIGARIAAQLPALRATSFDSIEAAAAVPGGFLGPGGTYFDINEAATRGSSPDPRFMTPERYLGSDGGLAATRGFLYNAMGLSRLYDGSGRTATPSGHLSLPEFLMPNREIATLPGGAQWLDLVVDEGALG